MDVGPAILILRQSFTNCYECWGGSSSFWFICDYELVCWFITPPVGTGLYVGASVGVLKLSKC